MGLCRLNGGANLIYHSLDVSMTKAVYFDLRHGISGDMTLGALLDAGVSLDEMRRYLRQLPVEGWDLEGEAVQRMGITGTRAHVHLAPLKHHHHGDHHHDHQHHHRRYGDIRAMLEHASLPGKALDNAQRAFALLAEAEAAVHNIPVDHVHFHEVGAVDAIIDIVGAMIGFELLGAQKFYASTVTVGSGEVKCEHGILPVPAPATARLLQGMPIEAGPVAMEMTTPTGAAILRALAPEFVPLPAMQLQKTAYGAGGREIEGRTNYLRLLIGEIGEHAQHHCGHSHVSNLIQLTTEIDDMNPEWYGPLLERLFQAGCLDASLESIYMKKNRPGVRVVVLSDPLLRDTMIEILLRHSTTFGVKVSTVERHCLPRKMSQVQTRFGAVGVKIGYLNGMVLKATAEYEDCRRLAAEQDVPVSTVYEAALEVIAKEYPQGAPVL